MNNLFHQLAESLTELDSRPLDDRMHTINELRKLLHQHSPMRDNPVDLVLWVKNDTVYANDYNPNSVAPPELKLLEISISHDGFCVAADTPVLCADLVWRPAGSLLVGQEIIAFDEDANKEPGRRAGGRQFKTAHVTHNEPRESPLVAVETEDGTVLCTPDHPWLAQPQHGDASRRTTRWVEAQNLRPGDKVMRLLKPWNVDTSYEAGWLAGFLDGEGTMTINLARGQVRAHRLAGYQRPGPTADHMVREMSSRALTSTFVLKRSSTKHPEWSDMVMCRVDRLPEIMRLLGSVRPDRLIEDGGRFWEGRSISTTGNTIKVLSVRPAASGTIASLSTSSRTYIADGYAMHNTQPIVSMLDEHGKREVVDGFHRHRIGKESEHVQSRVQGYLPVVQIRSTQTGRNDRIASTIRHNRARGKHHVEAMSDIVIELKRRNWSDDRIARELGMDADEVLRLCQITGLAEAFTDTDFSAAWEAARDDSSGAEIMSDVLTDFVADDKGRVYHTWEKWEVYRAGFYAERPPGKMTQDEGEAAYAVFLGDLGLFRAALEVVVGQWAFSCEHFLTNDRMNRIAWLGQAAMAQATGVPSTCRGGYHAMSQEKQLAADELALEYLNRWLVAYGREATTLILARGRTEMELY